MIAVVVISMKIQKNFIKRGKERRIFNFTIYFLSFLSSL